MLNMLNTLDVEATGELIARLSLSTRNLLPKDMEAPFPIGFGKTDGEISSLTYTFPLQGIWSIYGVGKGWPVERVKATGALMGGKGRQKKDWLYKPVLDPRIPILADMVARIKADQTAASIKVN